MKLKRICKLDYDDKDQPIIPLDEGMIYDVYFIDSNDWLCIDEDDYTPDKVLVRNHEKLRNRYPANDTLTTSFVFTPYQPLEYIKISFDITDGKSEFK